MTDMPLNRHERRKAAKTPRVMKFIIDDVEMTFTPNTIERIWREWESENPGQDSRDMPRDEFARRCLQAIKDSARPMQVGNA